MNDPMEGMYYYHWADEYTHDLVQRIGSEKEKLGICSLSQKNDNQLMWSHYSDGNKGLVIGLELNDQGADLKPVRYVNEFIRTEIYGSLQGKAREILSTKLKAWEYEEEQRVFVSNEFVNIEIKEVILGARMPQATKVFLKDLLKKLNDQIQVIEQNI